MEPPRAGRLAAVAMGPRAARWQGFDQRAMRGMDTTEGPVMLAPIAPLP